MQMLLNLKSLVRASGIVLLVFFFNVSGHADTIIIPQSQDGVNVWVGSEQSILTEAQIAQLVGVSGLSKLYESSSQPPSLATNGGGTTALQDQRIIFQAIAATPTIHVTISNPGAVNSPLSVSVIGNDLLIILSTDASGAVSSTAAQVAAAVNASPAASSFLKATTYGSSGTGIVPVMASTALTPGTVTVTDGGLFGSSYETAFSNTTFDPQHAVIDYITGPSITGDQLFLYIKDGGDTPASYIYRITGWDGTDNLVLNGFLPRNGIGYVKIVGTPVSTVPEMPSVVLLACAFAAVFAVRLSRDKGSVSASEVAVSTRMR